MCVLWLVIISHIAIPPDSIEIMRSWSWVSWHDNRLTGHVLSENNNHVTFPFHAEGFTCREDENNMECPDCKCTTNYMCYIRKRWSSDLVAGLIITRGCYDDYFGGTQFSVSDMFCNRNWTGDKVACCATNLCNYGAALEPVLEVEKRILESSNASTVTGIAST